MVRTYISMVDRLKYNLPIYLKHFYDDWNLYKWIQLFIFYLYFVDIFPMKGSRTEHIVQRKRVLLHDLKVPLNLTIPIFSLFYLACNYSKRVFWQIVISTNGTSEDWNKLVSVCIMHLIVLMYLYVSTISFRIYAFAHKSSPKSPIIHIQALIFTIQSPLVLWT